MKMSTDKEKAMAAELHFNQDKEMQKEEMFEANEEVILTSAQSRRKRQAEDGNEEVIFDVDFNADGKLSNWGFKMRQMIVYLLVIGLSPDQIGPTVMTMGSCFILPSDRFMRQMYFEMRIIVETLAARTATDIVMRIAVRSVLLTLLISFGEIMLL